MILFCSRFSHCGAVLGGVKAKPCGWPTASLDPTCGRHRFEQRREQEGEWEWGLGGGLASAFRCRSFGSSFPLYC